MTADTQKISTSESVSAAFQPATPISCERTVDSSLSAAQSIRSILTNRIEGEVRVRISASEPRFPRSEKNTL